MSNWTYHCGRVICNLADAISTMTGPMRLDDTCGKASLSAARLRLLSAKRLANAAVLSIDKLIEDLEERG